MKQINLTVYEFNELSDSAKKKAISDYSAKCYDYEWWDFIYEDASYLCLDIHSFDIDRRSIDIRYNDDPEYVAVRIINNWGKDSELYKIANKYLESASKLQVIESDDELYDSYELIELNDDFLHDLGEVFLSFLNSEYEWRHSEECISEIFECNEYQFFEDGSLYR